MPAIQQLLWSCEEHPTSWSGVGAALKESPGVREAAANCTSATDRVSHTLLTALAAAAHHPHHHHNKEHTQK